MTRILSQLLGAREPGFRHGIRKLEQASGLPSEDIRLSSELIQRAHEHIRALNLDPRDTTAEELYQALIERVRRDNQTLQTILGSTAAGDNLMPAVERLLADIDMPREVFALKATVAKRLLKAHAPKRTMKALGYRSLDSMLKHEPVFALYAAARVAESAAWHKTLLSKYKKLLPSDFEVRAAVLLAPTHDRWEKLAANYVAHHKHTILSFRELGAVVLLPLHGKAVEGVPLAVTLLTVQALNDLRANSTFLKLHQVRSDFGDCVAQVAVSEPLAGADLAGTKLPWKLIHRYFARHRDAFVPELFEPHVHAEDLQWRAVEDVLAGLHPTFEFWQGNSHVGTVLGTAAVSLNPIDAVLNFMNHVPFERRLMNHVRVHLWHELMLRYMKQANLRQALHEQLEGELVEHAVLT